jgi:hypothetical protein
VHGYLRPNTSMARFGRTVNRLTSANRRRPRILNLPHLADKDRLS